jgi:hypothetical protein
LPCLQLTGVEFLSVKKRPRLDFNSPYDPIGIYFASGAKIIYIPHDGRRSGRFYFGLRHLPTYDITVDNVSQYVEINPGLDNLQTEGPGVNWEQVRKENDKTACKMELRVVQTALDTMMIKEGLLEVQATYAMDDMTTFSAGLPLYPRYLR